MLPNNPWGEAEDVDLERHEASWLAALIDGEGTIGVYRQSFKKLDGTYRYGAVVQIASSSITLLHRAQSFVPGYVGLTGKPKQEHHKQMFRFRVRSAFVEKILEEVMPFLLVKFEQARITKDMATLVRRNPQKAYFRFHEKFEEYYQMTRLLNGVGKGGRSTSTTVE